MIYKKLLASGFTVGVFALAAVAFAAQSTDYEVNAQVEKSTAAVTSSSDYSSVAQTGITGIQKQDSASASYSFSVSLTDNEENSSVNDWMLFDH